MNKPNDDGLAIFELHVKYMYSEDDFVDSAEIGNCSNEKPVQSLRFSCSKQWLHPLSAKMESGYYLYHFWSEKSAGLFIDQKIFN